MAALEEGNPTEREQSESDAAVPACCVRRMSPRLVRPTVRCGARVKGNTTAGALRHAMRTDRLRRLVRPAASRCRWWPSCSRRPRHRALPRSVHCRRWSRRFRPRCRCHRCRRRHRRRRSPCAHLRRCWRSTPSTSPPRRRRRGALRRRTSVGSSCRLGRPRPAAALRRRARWLCRRPRLAPQ